MADRPRAARPDASSAAPFRFSDFVVNDSNNHEESESDDDVVDDFALSSDDNFIQTDDDSDDDGGAQPQGNGCGDAPPQDAPFCMWTTTAFPEPDDQGNELGL